MRVVVTRPEQDAQPWVAELREHGHDVLALPLIAISPVSDRRPLQQAWAQLSQYHAVMFVSGNAVDQFCVAQAEPSLQGWRRLAPHTRAWATGPGTRRALLGCGVAPECIDAPPADAGQFDSEALWRTVQGTVGAGQRVLIVRGGDGRESANAAPGVGRDWLANTLGAAGAQVEFVVAYERRPPLLSAQQLAQVRQASSDQSVWLFSSSEAIANLRHSVPDVDWSGAQALVTHPRIAQAARDAGFGVVRESRPSLAEVVASIESRT